MPTRAIASFLVCAVSALATGASAMGFGKSSVAAELGQPLNLTVPVLLSAGEQIEPGCARARALVGEAVWDGEQMQVRIEPGKVPGQRLARIVSSAPVTEPAIEVTLTIGCAQPFSRRFVAFADPPGLAEVHRASAPTMAGAPNLLDVSAAEGAAAADARAAASSASSLPSASASGRAPAQPSVAKRGDRRVAQTRRDASPAPAARTRAAAPSDAAAAAGLARDGVARARGSRVAPSRLLLDVGGPRLKLDMEEPVFMPRAAAPTDGSGHATPSDGAADAGDRTADAATQQLAALQSAVSAQRQARAAAEETAGALQHRLATAERRARAAPWLAALLLLSIAVAAWLARRLWALSRPRAVDTGWWASEVQPGMAPAEGDADATAPSTLEPGRSGQGVAAVAPYPDAPDDARAASAMPSAAAQNSTGWTSAPPLVAATKGAADDFSVRDYPDGPGEATAPLPAAIALALEQDTRRRPAVARTVAPEAQQRRRAPEPSTGSAPSEAFSGMSQPGVLGDALSPADMSVDELLDLEQQADFFLALGQDEAAVDLLMSHLRSTGGQSPLPYIKLLEIYRRREDHEAYERIRVRFNRRFNAYAPDWQDGPGVGHGLEAYPEAVSELQARWTHPIDAMALLESMLFRRDAAKELFDLPAYKDVLLLYGLARELWLQQGGERSPGIDVLLPLAADAGVEQQDPPT